MSNPYAAPALESDHVVRGGIRGELQPIEPLRFRSHRKRADFQLAVLGTPFRRELRSMTKVLVGFVLFMLVVEGLTIFQGVGASGFRLAMVGAPAILFISLVQLWTARKIARLQDDSCGDVSGSLDHQSFCVQAPNHTSVWNLDALVVAACNRKRMLLCFDMTLNRFETIRWSDFEEPERARSFVTQLARMQPTRAAEVIDRRRQELPNAIPVFERGENAIDFHGPVYFHEIGDATVKPEWRRLMLKMAITLALVWLLLSAFAVLSIGSTETLILSLSIGFAFSLLMLRFFMQGRGVATQETPLWQAIGWIDDSGMVAITTTGQSHLRWTLFRSAKINDQCISLPFQKSPNFCFLTRGQFENDEAWQTACESVTRHMKEVALPN